MVEILNMASGKGEPKNQYLKDTSNDKPNNRWGIYIYGHEICVNKDKHAS